MGQFSSLLSRLNKSRSIIALQDASISLVPMILTLTFLMMLAEGLALVSSLAVIELIRSLYQYFYLFFPLIFTVSLAVSFAKSKEVDPTSMVIISVSLLTLSVAGNVTTLEQLDSSTYFKIIPIPLCYFTATVLSHFVSKSSMQMFNADFMSLHLNKTFNYIIPSAFTFALVFVLFMLFEAFWQTFMESGFLTNFKIEDTGNILGIIALKFIYKLTWFFGVNPSHVFNFLQEPYFAVFAENKLAYMSDQTIPHINVPGNYIFTDIGGAGSVMSLLLAILIFSKSNRNKRVAKLSALPCAFNISEIIHYGLPIVFNPYLFIPFVLVPILTYLNTYLIMSIGLVSPVVVSVPWTTPPLLNAYLATGGDFGAVLLQLINLGIGVFIYLKFLKMLEASHLDEGLVSDFVSKFNLESKNIQALQYRNQRSLMKNIESENEINSFLLSLSQGQLMLYYQPIVDSQSKQVAKVEALLRLQDKHGNIQLPTFINMLSQVGLSTDIDRWVVKQVVKQSHDWSDRFSTLEISINISPRSLLERDFVDFLVDMNKKAKHAFCIEILENQAVFEEQTINKHLKILNDQGVSVFLDDFGSGYSALSMLSKLNINGVKYDIDFSSQLQIKEGSKLLKSCLDLSNNLKHTTVLEGIETKEQYDEAMELGVHYLQGFYIAKPLPKDELELFIDNKLKDK